MEGKEIVSDLIKFYDVVELVEALTRLNDDAQALDRGAVVYVRADAPFQSGIAYLEAEALSDGSTVYNIVIRGAA